MSLVLQWKMTHDHLSWHYGLCLALLPHTTWLRCLHPSALQTEGDNEAVGSLKMFHQNRY